MSACERSRQLNAYYDDELAAEERAELATHIQQCLLCAGELERLRGLSRLLDAAAVPEMPAGVLERLHGRVGSVREVFVLRTAARLMAAAAMLLVVCGVWLWQTAGAHDTNGEMLEGWEIAAVSLQTGAPAAASAEELLAQWIVSDLGRENGID